MSKTITLTYRERRLAEISSTVANLKEAIEDIDRRIAEHRKYEYEKPEGCHHTFVQIVENGLKHVRTIGV
jgi:hypothetical protein